MIGLDNAKLCVPVEVRENLENDLVAARCKLGWRVFGKFSAGKDQIQRVLHICPIDIDNKMDDM